MKQRITKKNEKKSKQALVNILSCAYLNEKCKFCKKEFKTLKDLKTAVWAGYHEGGRLAHKKCWEKNGRVA